MDREFPKVKHKVIDSHLHFYDWRNENGVDFFHCFEEYRQEMGLSGLNLCALPSGHGADVTSNLMCAIYKLINKETFASGGLLYDKYPMGEKLPDGMDFVTQLNELEAIGFDGIKMLEGKPTLHRTIGKNLLHPEFDKFFAEAEKRGTHITFHANDPKEFWTEPGADYHGDPTFATSEEIYRQAYKILENHPNLKVTFAHFFFMSEKPEELARLFDKYPNMCVDLTPGWEMYLSFYAKKEYFKEFFEKYSKRIILGTDAYFPRPTECSMWLVDRVYRFISSPDVIKAVADRYESGLCISDRAIEDITYKNFEERISAEPKPINKDALIAYYKKYKHLMTEKDVFYTDEVFAKFL
jgi:predicted TIM-barrel fold metal-dependent hydrolase